VSHTSTSERGEGQELSGSFFTAWGSPKTFLEEGALGKAVAELVGKGKVARIFLIEEG